MICTEPCTRALCGRQGPGGRSTAQHASDDLAQARGLRPSCRGGWECDYATLLLAMMGSWSCQKSKGLLRHGKGHRKGAGQSKRMTHFHLTCCQSCRASPQLPGLCMVVSSAGPHPPRPTFRPMSTYRLPADSPHRLGLTETWQTHGGFPRPSSPSCCLLGDSTPVFSFSVPVACVHTGLFGCLSNSCPNVFFAPVPRHGLLHPPASESPLHPGCLYLEPRTHLNSVWPRQSSSFACSGGLIPPPCPRHAV